MMRQRQYYITIVFIALSFSLNGQIIEHDSALRFQSNLIGVSNAYVDKDGIEKYLLFIDLRIINNSDSCFAFWTMTCSWNSLVTVDSDSIFVHLHNCDANYPTLIKLKKNEIFQASLKLKTDKSFVTNHLFEPFKIGFVLIRDGQYPCQPYYTGCWQDIIKDKHEKNDYIWSNSLKLVNQVRNWKILK